MDLFAGALVAGLEAWGMVGLAFAVPFVLRGVQRIDPLARDATVGFRLVIVPGVVIFWPLLAARWALGARRPPVEVNPHRLAAGRPEAA
jgi:hypothetical protein